METESVIPHITSKTDLVRELTFSLPTNTFGLLDGFYRVDLLPNPNLDTPDTFDSLDTPLLPGESDGELPALSNRQIALTAHIDPSVLKSAYVPLSYQEGFPALPDGMPFWSQLDFEPLREFKEFQRYLEQGKEGARQIFLLHNDNSDSDNAYLQEIAVLHYWPMRARAYDLFKIASLKYQQEMRTVDMLNGHYSLAAKLLERARLYIEDEEFQELLTPSTAIDALKVATQLQRLSVGLPPGAAPPSSKDAPTAAGNIEVILRSLVPHKDQGETLVQQDDGSFALNKALENPETAAIAQELIIKIQRSNAA